MEFIYEELEHNELLSSFKNSQTICKSLAYMLTFESHNKLKVHPREHSIEIFNEKITISIILFVGYEDEEFYDLKNRKNYHIVTFSKFTKEMHEFTEFRKEIKFVEPKALFYTSLSFAEDRFCNNLKTLLEI